MTSCARPATFLLGFGKLVQQPVLVLGHGLAPRLDQGRNRRVGLTVPALLDHDLLLLADKVLQVGQVEDFGPNSLSKSCFRISTRS
jgi:hypothetical protein